MGDEDSEQVYTSVPQYQKEAWVDHADSLDMSQSEFVRTMVQAGRRGFGAKQSSQGDARSNGGSNPKQVKANIAENVSEPVGGDVDPFEARVRDVLEREQHLSWDELVTALTEDFEDRLEATLQNLQDAGVVRHSGRHGGYTLVDP